MSKFNQFFLILNNKCPRCNIANIFKYKAFNILKFHKIHDNCSHCKVNFYPEPGFYIGAMYVSYAINVFVLITLFLSINIFFNPKLLSTYFFIIVPTILLIWTLNFRFSRSLMLHLFGDIQFDKKFQ